MSSKREPEELARRVNKAGGCVIVWTPRRSTIKLGAEDGPARRLVEYAVRANGNLDSMLLSMSSHEDLSQSVYAKMWGWRASDANV